MKMLSRDALCGVVGWVGMAVAQSSPFFLWRGRGQCGNSFVSPAASCWAARGEITKIIRFYYRSAFSSISSYIERAPRQEIPVCKSPLFVTIKIMYPFCLPYIYFFSLCIIHAICRGTSK